MKKNFTEIEIPFGVKDSELYQFTYTIPDGYSAEIKDGKVIVKKKESEDERVNRAIFKALSKKEARDVLRDEHIEVSDALAYLEKQKEQKPSTPQDIAAAYQMGLAAGRKEQKPLSTEETELNSIAFLEQLGYTCIPPGAEQKPAEYINITQKILDYIDKDSRKYENKRPVLGDVWVVTKKCTFPNVFNGKPVVEVEKDGFGWMRLPEEIVEVKNGQKKPAETDNEEIELSDFESELFSVFSDGWQQYLHGEEVDVAQWTKEHSAQLLNAAKQELKPAEWRENDEDCRDEICRIINNFADSPEQNRELTDWLKSLRPQPHWKPSEEQMEALNKVVNGEVLFTTQHKSLESLYNDLKSL